MSKRIEYLDIAKGIGILFVVLGHNHIKIEYPVIYKVVYSFHMPFFFLLSGMFFNPAYSFLELTRKRFSSLLKPFIAHLIVIYCVIIFFSKIDLQISFIRLLKAFYAGPSTLEWVPVWFVPHLLLVNLLAFVLIKLIYDRLPKLWMRLLLLAIMIGIGVAILPLFKEIHYPFTSRKSVFYGLPWSADIALITTAFFMLGYEGRRTILENPDGIRYGRWWLIAALLLFVGLNATFNTTIDFFVRHYDPVVSTLEAISGSILILWLSKQIEKGPTWLAGVFKYLGGASIVILIFHYIPQEILYHKLNEINVNTFLASFLSYCAGVFFPLLVYTFVIRPNKLLCSWFGINS